MQYQYGMNSVANDPHPINEMETIKPLSPEKAKLDALKRQKETVSNQLKAERDRQKMKRAQQQIFNLSRPI